MGAFDDIRAELDAIQPEATPTPTGLDFSDIRTELDALAPAESQVATIEPPVPQSGLSEIRAELNALPTPTQKISPVAQQLRDDNIGKLPTLGRVAPPPEPQDNLQNITQDIRRRRDEVVTLKKEGRAEEAAEKEEFTKFLIEQRGEIGEAKGVASNLEAKASALTSTAFGLKSILGGATFGLSDIASDQLEKALDIKIGPNSTREQVLGSVTRLLSGVLTGGKIASSSGMQALISKLGVKGAQAALHTRAILSGGISLTNNASQIISGDKSLTDGLRDASVGFLSSMAGVAPEAMISNPWLNATGQILTDFSIDLASDALLTDRVKDKGFMNWLLTQELPNLVGSAIFAGQDLVKGVKTPAEFKAYRNNLKTELKKSFQADVKKFDSGAPVEVDIKTDEPVAEAVKRTIETEQLKKQADEQAPADPELAAIETQLKETFSKQLGASDDAAETRARTLLAKTQKQADVPDSVKQKLADVDPQDYNVVKNADVLQAAATKVSEGADAVQARLNTDEPPSAERTALAVALRDHYRATGNSDAEADLTIKMDEELRRAGQGIQAAVMWYRGSPEGIKKGVRKMMTNEGAVITKDIDAELTRLSDEISKMPEGSEEKAKAIDDMMDYASERLPWRVKWGSRFDQYRINNMLSNPRSTARNVFSNTLQTLLTRPLSLAGQALKGDAKLKDIPLWYKDTLSKIGEGFSKATEAYEQATFEASKNNEFAGKNAMQIALNKKTPKAISMFTRFMEAQDVFFSTMIEAGEGSRLMRGGTDEAVAQRKSKAIAEEYLFRRKVGSDVEASKASKLRIAELKGQLADAKSVGDSEAVKDISNKIDLAKQDIDALAVRAIDGLASGIEGLRNKPYIGKVASFMIPFLRTPFNVAKQGVKATPLGFLGGKNKETRGMATVGSMVTMVGAIAALEGRTTWAPPKGADERREFYNSGRRPYSVQIGDKHIPMWYFGPFAFSLAIPAAARDALQDNPELAGTPWHKRLTKVVQDLAGFYAEQTPMAGAGLFMKVLSGQEDFTTGKALGFTGGQVIPGNGMIRYVNNYMDPTYRKATSFGDSLKKDIPILSKQLDAHLDGNDDPVMRTVGDIVLPWAVGTKNPEGEKVFQDTLRQSREKKGQIALAREVIKDYRDNEISLEDLTVYLDGVPPGIMKEIRSTISQDLKKAKVQRKIQKEQAGTRILGVN